MPAAREYPLPALKKSLAEYNRLSGQPVTLVYMLLRDINDSPEDAKALVKFAKSLFIVALKKEPSGIGKNLWLYNYKSFNWRFYDCKIIHTGIS